MRISSTIAISRGTRDMLKEIGRKGETYDELIRQLINVKRNLDSPDSRFESLPSSKSMNP
jgi:hypothetical protein